VLTGCYWTIGREFRNWCVTGIGKLLTARECIVWTCMVSGADWMLLGDLTGCEILVGERNWETVDCRRMHIAEVHVE